MPADAADFFRILNALRSSHDAAAQPWLIDMPLAAAFPRPWPLFSFPLADIQETFESLFHTTFSSRDFERAVYPLRTHTFTDLCTFLAAHIILPDPPATPEEAHAMLLAAFRARRIKRLPAPEDPVAPFAVPHLAKFLYTLAILSRGRLSLPPPRAFLSSRRMNRLSILFVAQFLVAIALAFIATFAPAYTVPLMMGAGTFVLAAIITILYANRTRLPGDITWPAVPWPTFHDLAAALANLPHEAPAATAP